MRKMILAAASVVAVLGFSAPAMAQDWNGGWHDRAHDRLDQRHDDAHDQLEEEHHEAHEQGLTPWEHRQLHRELRWQHDDADYELQRQHQRQHQRHRHWDGYGYRGSYGDRSYGY